MCLRKLRFSKTKCILKESEFVSHRAVLDDINRILCRFVYVICACSGRQRKCIEYSVSISFSQTANLLYYIPNHNRIVIILYILCYVYLMNSKKKKKMSILSYIKCIRYYNYSKTVSYNIYYVIAR